MVKVHIVNHTHWDREWYFTTSDALVLSENSFTEVLDELEKNPRAKFCLDGQTSIIDEYIEVRPERMEQLIKFVKQKRLSIGPWYTQTDTFLVNGESIIRNLTLGIRDSKKYGGYMDIGYLPDTFGFNAQMPTIIKNCGINEIIFFRGIDFDKHVSSPYFIWKGLSNKEVIAVNLVKGYGVAAFLEDSDIYINNKLLPITNRLKSLTDLSEILIPIGEDQLDIVSDLPEKLESISKRTEDKYEISSYEEFMKYLHKQTSLESYIGEFKEPCLSRVHKSIASIRYDIKKINFTIEQKLLNRIEPLMAIAHANGINISEKLLHKAWKKILETQAHDGIGGCVSDNVAVDILHRMKEADEIADGIENLILKRFAEKVSLKENEIIVFNTLPIPFSGYRKVQIIASSKNIKIFDCDESLLINTDCYEARDNVRIVDSDGERYIKESAYYNMTFLAKMDLPAMGYKIFKFDEKEKYTILDLNKNNDKNISNKYYTIELNDSVLELTTSFGKKITDFIQFEDCGNDGDTYDFSPLADDKPILLSLALEEIFKSPIQEVMTLSGKFDLPYKLCDRLENNSKKSTMSIKLNIILTKNTDRIEVKCTVDNQIYSHRLRVKINTDILANKTIASLPFGYIKRDVINNLPTNWQKNYVEIPIDIETFDASVSVECDQYNFTAFAKGMKEYQFIKDSLYLTLFSTTSQLGKENLIYRPGRASGDTTRQGHVMIETPMAELIGISEFEFAFSICKGQFDEYKTAKEWEDYTIEHVSYQMQTLNKFIHRLDNKIQLREKIVKAPTDFSLLELSKDMLFSSISPSLHDDAILLRLKNPTGENKKLVNADFSRFAKTVQVNYIEEICENQDFIIEAYDTLTVKMFFRI